MSDDRRLTPLAQFSHDALHEGALPLLEFEQLTGRLRAMADDRGPVHREYNSQSSHCTPPYTSTYDEQRGHRLVASRELGVGATVLHEKAFFCIRDVISGVRIDSVRADYCALLEHLGAIPDRQARLFFDRVLAMGRPQQRSRFGLHPADAKSFLRQLNMGKGVTSWFGAEPGKVAAGVRALVACARSQSMTPEVALSKMTNVLSISLFRVSKRESVLCEIASRFEHSCDPNCAYVWNKVQGSGTQARDTWMCTVRCVRRIVPGEPLSIAYRNDPDGWLRRQTLLSAFGFVCTCAQCKPGTRDYTHALPCNVPDCPGTMCEVVKDRVPPHLAPAVQPKMRQLTCDVCRGTTTSCLNETVADLVTGVVPGFDKLGAHFYPLLVRFGEAVVQAILSCHAADAVGEPELNYAALADYSPIADLLRSMNGTFRNTDVGYLLGLPHARQIEWRNKIYIDGLLVFMRCATADVYKLTDAEASEPSAGVALELVYYVLGWAADQMESYLGTIAAPNGVSQHHGTLNCLESMAVLCEMLCEPMHAVPSIFREPVRQYILTLFHEKKALGRLVAAHLVLNVLKTGKAQRSAQRALRLLGLLDW